MNIAPASVLVLVGLLGLSPIASAQPKDPDEPASADKSDSADKPGATDKPAEAGGSATEKSEATDTDKSAAKPDEPARSGMDAFDAAVMREAGELIREKRAKEAFEKLAPLARMHAGKPDFDLLYGLALIESGQGAKALGPLRRVLEADPNSIAARVQLARALTAAGALREARQELVTLQARKDLPETVRAATAGNIETIDAALRQREEAARQQHNQARVSQPAGARPAGGDAAAIQAAQQLIREKRPADALARLRPLSARLSGNPDFAYVFGVALLDDGRPAEAVGSLRRAVQARPDFHVARAELGRALAAMGDLSGARREYEAVRGVAGLPTDARDAIGRQVFMIDEAVAAQTTTRITGYFEAALGYDTNVNSGPAGSQLLIPALAFLGPATLAPGALPKEAGFYELAGGISVVHPVSASMALFVNIVGNVHPLLDHKTFRTALAGGEFGFAKQFGDFGILSVAGIGQVFWSGDDIYRAIYGVATQWRRRIAEWDTSLAGTWLALEYPEVEGTNADRYTATLSAGRTFDVPLQPSVSISASAGREIARTGGSEFLSFTLYGVRGTLQTMLAPTVVVFLQGGYEVHRHDADYPLFLRHRHDEILEAGGGVEIKFTEKFSLRPSVRWSMTRSNVDLFDTKRWIGSVAARSNF